MKKLIDAMVKNVEWIGPETSLADAAARMQALGIGALPVCRDEEVIGVLTDRDIVIRSVAEGRDPKRSRVQDVMTEEVVFSYDDEDLLQALERMRKKKVGRLIVLNRERRLRGLLTLGDLTRQLGKGHIGELISEKFSAEEGDGRGLPRARDLFVGLGALAGAASVYAGFKFLQGRRHEHAAVDETGEVA